MKIKELKQTFKQYYNLNNVVITVALLIALSWMWGTMEALQKNFTLQQEVDQQKQEVELLQLETQNLEFEKRYFASDEFIELAARERLGLASPGEKMILLPENTIKDKKTEENRPRIDRPTNFQQWMMFLFGSKQG